MSHVLVARLKPSLVTGNFHNLKIHINTTSPTSTAVTKRINASIYKHIIQTMLKLRDIP